jgi:hypothetical protein
MRRIVIFSMIVSLALLSCHGQTQDSKNEIAKDTTLPQTSIKVKKQYDQHGNVIGYDSTYSSYYSNIKGDTVMRDSIFNKFKNSFNENYFFSNEPYFKDFFFADSLLKYDFYKKDFFYNRFRDNMQRMDSLFRGMDVMKNDFFSRQNRIGKEEKPRK